MITVTSTPIAARPLPCIDNDVTLIDLIAARVEADPALGALDRRAARWADALAALDLGLGDRVAVDVRCGRDQLAALLGVLAVGAVAVLAEPGAADDPDGATRLTRAGVPVARPANDAPSRSLSLRNWPGADADEPALELRGPDGRSETLDLRTAVDCLLRTGSVIGARRGPGRALCDRLSALAMPRPQH